MAVHNMDAEFPIVAVGSAGGTVSQVLPDMTESCLQISCPGGACTIFHTCQGECKWFELCR
jgi:hypothetical protein